MCFRDDHEEVERPDFWETLELGPVKSHRGEDEWSEPDTDDDDWDQYEYEHTDINDLVDPEYLIDDENADADADADADGSDDGHVSGDDEDADRPFPPPYAVERGYLERDPDDWALWFADDHPLQRPLEHFEDQIDDWIDWDGFVDWEPDMGPAANPIIARALPDDPAEGQEERSRGG